MITGRPFALLAALVALALVTTAGPAAAAGAAPQRTWHADQIRVPEARAAGKDGAGVLVAVLDTWVDAAHRDFEGRVVTGADCSSGTCREGAPTPDACTHGTHVAGTVASSSYGVAPKAQVLPVKVLSQADGGRCSGTDTAVAAGIRYAVGKGARVLNLSLGTLVPGLSSSSAIAGAVEQAARAGAVVVFAAGNSSVPVADSYGGAALIVAATGPDGQLALYSQRGAGVTLAAPGGDQPALGDCTPQRCVTSLYPGDRYAVAAGTSMAAPHVAGVAALLLAQDPSRTRQQVVDRIRSTARPLAGAGDGLVDAAAALSHSRPARTASPAGPAPATAAPPASQGAAGPGAAAPAPSAEAAPAAATGEPSAAPEVEPLEPDPLPAQHEPPPGAEQQPLGTPDPLSAGAPPSLPPGPPAVATLLVLVAALATTLAGRSGRAGPPGGR